MATQTRMVAGFVGLAFGGPVKYEGKDLRSAHRALVEEHGLDDAHFDRMVEHFESTLFALEIAPRDVKEAVAILESTRNDVLCKPIVKKSLIRRVLGAFAR